MAVITRPSADEACSRGEAIYETALRDIVETEENIGKYISIDIYSGDYEIDRQHIDAVHRLRARKPDAGIYTVRVGYTTGAAIGARLQRRPPRNP